MLLNLCKTSGLRIVNGRALGDSVGYFTCFSHTGAPSVIDYMLAPQTFFKSIDSFQVLDPNDYSIHSILSIKIRTKHFLPQTTNENNLESINSFKWKIGDDVNFQAALNSQNVSNKVKSLLETDYS